MRGARSWYEIMKNFWTYCSITLFYSCSRMVQPLFYIKCHSPPISIAYCLHFKHVFYCLQVGFRMPYNVMRCVTRKQTLRSLSLSARLLEIYHLWSQKTPILKSRCHTKRRMGAATRAHPSFGMTTTKTLRPVFSWHASFNTQLGLVLRDLLTGTWGQSVVNFSLAPSVG